MPTIKGRREAQGFQDAVLGSGSPTHFLHLSKSCALQGLAPAPGPTVDPIPLIYSISLTHGRSVGGGCQQLFLQVRKMRLIKVITLPELTGLASREKGWNLTCNFPIPPYSALQYKSILGRVCVCVSMYMCISTTCRWTT